MKKYFLVLLVLLTIAACSEQPTLVPSVQQMPLTGEWQFKAVDDTLWLPATVPGCVHTDLMAANLIPDPYDRANEAAVQWVAQRTWEYRKQFNADSLRKQFKNIELVFDGIDTHAEILLNGEKLPATTPSGNTDNMFRTWRFNVTGLLNDGNNELLLRFFPVNDYNKSKAAKLPYQLPDERAFSRKAPYQLGWDWGPELATCGLWKPVTLQAWNDFTIENIHVVQNTLTDKSAQLTMELSIVADRKMKAKLAISVEGKALIIDQSIPLQQGHNTITQKISLKNPVCWNPAGLGAQKLYNILAILQGNAYKDSVFTKIGLRTIELRHEKDSIGTSFAFYVNGKPVFMKGANYIPQDNFPARVTPERHRKLLTAARDANMNMIRVWGGGIYEDDYFYHLCDSLGLLVWQDFMFACALYPGDTAFLQTVRHEAEDQVCRLRNHPCIALWCGNNEVKNGWEDWGWRKRYTEEQRNEIWGDNQAIFERMLPGVVQTYSTGTSYHTSSPEWGWGHPECITEGDSHYWGVWWGEEPFDVWEAKTGRFMSEYGFQAFPDFSTIESFTLPQDRSLNSAIMKAHQKNTRGYELIEKYMQRDYHVPKDFFHYIYVSQLLQAEGIGQALEIHRRRMPYCMGTLYWQLNDCWPVVSWSSIDSRYRWKALHYKARECFKPILLTTMVENDELVFYAVSDLQQTISGRISVTWQDFQGHILPLNLTNFKNLSNLTIAANSSRPFLRIPLSAFRNHVNTSAIVLRFDDGQGNTAEKIHYFVRPKKLQLPDYKINSTIEQVGSDYKITLVSDALVKNLYLYTNLAMDGFFSDNYLDLLPGETKTIIFSPAADADLTNFKKQLKILSLKEAK